MHVIFMVTMSNWRNFGVALGPSPRLTAPTEFLQRIRKSESAPLASGGAKGVMQLTYGVFGNDQVRYHSASRYWRSRPRG
jgi:hypothetical protein